ncbi:hypothetical protein KAFR_0B00150 [Kazachstania africana CBS 2517]|uniref:Uncharacterized protein n=1 Tax=Kazachstania africana (strain ATCC 22294 / BCRC 22015 / CBS 2517 / CECT 1963 / NBRC 1671 / NRRL Y-8276) TaxID=1071382 RepID=H2APL4_KAZAF|nr:hypothetical protein KAFR_0B00150 [Kazachstania africana CBS 2517]CCF56314.1 hypothetical protein KAFR_0B00150 [Kazachstania africana CBS 2517]
MVAAICKKCAASNLCCLGGAILTTIVAAAVAISFDSSAGGSTDYYTKRGLSDMVNVTYEMRNWTESFTASGLQLISAFNLTDTYEKRDDNVLPLQPYIHFSSEYGNHVAVNFGDGTLNHWQKPS